MTAVLILAIHDVSIAIVIGHLRAVTTQPVRPGCGAAKFIAAVVLRSAHRPASVISVAPHFVKLHRYQTVVEAPPGTPSVCGFIWTPVATAVPHAGVEGGRMEILVG